MTIYHSSDSVRLGQALAAFPAVIVIRLRSDRFWIATTEFDNYQLYRRVLVDSAWNVVSRGF